MNIYYHPSFKKKYQKLTKKDPQLKKRIKKALSLFIQNPQHRSLRLHKLQGMHHRDWSISVTQDIRIIFFHSQDAVVLSDIGKHDQVY